MPNKFYSVIRQFYKNGTETHSVEPKAEKLEAIQRFFNIIAADLADPDIEYNAAYIIDSDGVMLEARVFDRREIPVQEG